MAAKRLKAEIENIEQRTGMVEDQREVIAPASAIGKKIGEWLRTITNFDWAEAGTQIFRDLNIGGDPSTAKETIIEIKKGKREQTETERRWLERYRKGAKGSHTITKGKP